ncbi:GntR family transcriptional regulator [uncultured Paracoccus sp.]|uniref:GntR family transcriptional regulator n=1 Tax=uncultured Paracoccus sp. TaxID=189685 RepID=UPI002602AFF4|nr:GntR family transcriptional regulator [uncultured Paracoccus sp.]
MSLSVKSRTPLRRKSLHEELTQALQELIIRGDLQPGKKVPEKDLCALYGVSRTPLREALKVLAMDGLVRLEPNHGAWVSQITIEDLDEVFPVMAALEALAGELACRNITDDEVRAIRVLHDRMVAHYEAHELDGYFATNQQIHEAILAAARNATLSAQYRSLAARVRRARYVANMTPERWARATEEHEAIMRCLEDRNAEGLSAILKQHLRNKLETVREWLLAQPAADNG